MLAVALLTLVWQVFQASAMQFLRTGSNGDLPLRDIILVAGQSNAVGLGVSSELPAELATPPANMLVWPTTNGVEWSSASVEAARFGPELSFAYDVAKLYEQRHESFGILKVAKFSSSLRYDWALSAWESLAADTPKLRQLNARLGEINQERDDSAMVANGTASGEPVLFATLVDTVRQAMKAPQCEGGRCRIGALLWLQGEMDANSEEDAVLYESELTNFVNTLRSALESPDLFVVISGLAPDLVGVKPAADVVLQAQQNYTAMQGPSRAVFVPTDGVTKFEDRLHYNTNGLLDLGHRLAKAYAPLLTPSAAAA